MKPSIAMALKGSMKKAPARVTARKPGNSTPLANRKRLTESPRATRTESIRRAPVPPASKGEGGGDACHLRPVDKIGHTGCSAADSRPKDRKYRSFETRFACMKPILRLICGVFGVSPGGLIRKLQCGRSGGAPQIRLFALRADALARPGAFERISAHQTLTWLYLVNLVRLRLLVVFFGLAHGRLPNAAMQHTNLLTPVNQKMTVLRHFSCHRRDDIPLSVLPALARVRKFRTRRF